MATEDIFAALSAVRTKFFDILPVPSCQWNITAFYGQEIPQQSSKKTLLTTGSAKSSLNDPKQSYFPVNSLLFRENMLRKPSQIAN
jgi:hypothetical protein